MAKEYLDKTGLTYLWSKLKTLLGSKQDDVGLSVVNGKVCVTYEE